MNLKMRWEWDGFVSFFFSKCMISGYVMRTIFNKFMVFWILRHWCIWGINMFIELVKCAIKKKL
jgi:hypothetical protein